MSRLVVSAAPLADHCHASLLKKSSHERCTKLRAEYAFVACAQLPGSELIAASARAFASHVLRTWDCSVLLDRVVLVVSELATNALLHGCVRARTLARIYRDGDAVWFEIDDRSTAEPQIRPPGADIDERAGGRGLLLVDALTDGFGWREAESGKTVFARWSLSAAAEQAGAAASGTEAVDL
jgi:anti-sigma regulatory factor (Ser/Thr protein kinase)